MATYRQLIAKAKELGHELTPELKADLSKLATIPDSDIQAVIRKQRIKALAADFKVPVPVMELRFKNTNT